MRHILIAGAITFAAAGQALAADLPPPMAPPPRAPATYVPAAPVFSWTGIYVGVNGGYGFGNSIWTNAAGASTGNFNTSGGLAGGTIGGNYQFGSFVVGLEGDGDWSGVQGTFTGVAGGPCAAGCTTSTEWLSTVRGRAGYAFDRLLIFATGGGAFGNIKGASAAGSGTSTQAGWTAGAGLEYAITPNWSVKAEYLYVSLEKASCTPCGAVAPPISIGLNENLVRAGINYKFW